MRFVDSYNIIPQFLRFNEENFILTVYDIETTGLKFNAGDRIIQFSARKCFVNPEGLSEASSANWYINPGRSLPEEIVKLTGITDELLADKPRESEAIREIAEFIGTDPICGYNNDRFDNIFLKLAYERAGLTFEPADSVDVYRMVKEIVPPGATKDLKLKTMIDYFGLSDIVQNSHNAMDDSLATLLMYNKLLAHCRENFGEECSHLIRCNISSVNRYEKDTGKGKIRRIYVNTDKGDFFFDISQKRWCVKDKRDRLSRYDVDDLIEKTYQFTGCSTIEGLCKYA